MSNQHDMQPAPLRQRRVIRVYNNLQDTRRPANPAQVIHNATQTVAWVRLQNSQITGLFNSHVF
jgi:hypothetical protein